MSIITKLASEKLELNVLEIDEQYKVFVPHIMFTCDFDLVWKHECPVWVDLWFRTQSVSGIRKKNQLEWH